VEGVDSMARLERPDGYLSVEEIGGDRRRLETVTDDADAFVGTRTWETAYPLDLIETILDVKGLRSVCDEIRREEDPQYLQHVLWWTLRAHVDVEEAGSARILDFGCGSGASTMILSRMFPEATFLGLDIDAEANRIAEGRRRFYDVDRVEFRLSDEPTGVPEEIGEFDFIVFSALLEHLLPEERKTVIPALWSRLRPGGLLFLGETPHRYTPVEIHTTGGLPLVNYLPPALTLWAAKRFSPRIGSDATWEELLRRGMRGGTEKEFLRYLERAGYDDATIERPTKQGLEDEFDLWFEISHVNEMPGFKTKLRSAFRGLKKTTGISFTPYLAFAVRKRAEAVPAAASS
jgi:SAM-dependent methyltransferase